MARTERVLIVLNGERPPKKDIQFWAAGATHVVAADGGAHALAAAGVEADTIIGDLDSSTPRVRKRFADAEILHEAAQDRTDFQKALAFALGRRQATQIAVMGAEGSRLDHTLSALFASIGVASKTDVCFVLERSVAHIVVEGKPRAFACLPGILVSAIPLLPSKFRSGSGLHWPVDNLGLAPGARDGISNRATGNRVEVELACGCVAMFVERHGEERW